MRKTDAVEPFRKVDASIRNFKEVSMALATLCDSLVSTGFIQEPTIVKRLKEHTEAFWKALNGEE